MALDRTLDASAAEPVEAPAAAPAADEAETEASAAPAGPPIPDAVVLPGGGRVSAYVIAESLADLGFDNIGNAQKVGTIAHVTASWQGAPVTLRIDTQNGSITVKQ